MSLEEHFLAFIAALKSHTEALAAHTVALGKAPKGGKKAEPESPPSSISAPAASAPAAAGATSTAGATPPPTAAANPQLLAQTTEAVIKLANEYSREQAVGILAKYKVTRCSDLKLDQLELVLTEATAAITVAQAAKQAATANASLV